MILYELYGTEDEPVYRELARENLQRQYDFLGSIIKAAISQKQRMISTALIQALNYHAIACLHIKAGEYRPCDVEVKASNLKPPQHYRVPAMMDHFVNEVNSAWRGNNGWEVAAYCLWRLNFIHPFINGNGRTARALCYYVACINVGQVLPGRKSFPERIRTDRHDEYVALLRSTDEQYKAGSASFLTGLRDFLVRLAREQISGRS